jgi:hypothetical protein
MYVNQYATPKDYAIPSPYGPRVHNWKGGPLNEGSLYHGPNYTRPSYRMPWIMRPSLRGLGQVSSELLVGAFLINAAFVNPKAAGRIEAKMKALFDARDSEGMQALADKLEACIRKEAPRFIDFVENPPLPGSSAEPSDFISSKEVETIVACTESKGSNLGIILPLVAVGALVIWLFARKK